MSSKHLIVCVVVSLVVLLNCWYANYLRKYLKVSLAPVFIPKELWVDVKEKPNNFSAIYVFTLCWHNIN